MIIVRLIGGLGNQMFQYAAARALADRLGKDLLLDVRSFDTYTLHAYGLEKFRVRARRASCNELAAYPEWQRRLLTPLRKVGVRSRFYSEPFFGYDAAWPSLGDGVHLNGYFQSEQYFSPIRSTLREDFIPQTPLSDENRRIASLAQEGDSVMIHVRRGDYITDAKAFSIHGVCGPQYYCDAIALIRQRCSSARFFVFSNDMDWARKNLALGEDAIFVEGNSKNPEVDILLMAQCHHQIIANSSFSWWGAWLGRKSTSITVSPSPWFERQDINESSLIPHEWIRLKK